MPPRKSSQSQSAKSKGKKRARRDDDDEEEAEEEQDSGEEQTQARKGKKEKLGPEGIARHAASVVRLALFCEQKKSTLKRDDITKKILLKDARAFQDVFDAAQKILHKTFGMELVQLRGKGKGAGGDNDDGGDEPAPAAKKGKGKKKKDDDEEEEDGEEDRAATMRKRRKTVVSGPARTWMLRSTIPAELYQLAAEPHPELPSFQGEDADEDRPPSGAVIDFKFGDDTALVGLLYAILSLILVNGRRLLDTTLRSYLRRLNLESATQLPTAPTAPSQTLESFLALLVRTLYLEKAKIVGVDGAAGRGNDGEDLSIEWLWGARADAEIGETGLTEWIGEVFLEEEEGEGEDEELTAAEAKRAREKKEKRGDRLRKEIVRAAGGALQD